MENRISKKQEHWHDTITEKSWNILLELVKSKEFKFTVIGGWAVYLHTRALKSKDIDLVLENWEELDKLKNLYNLRKNDRLFKYEFFKDGIEVDIYVPGFSKLAIPCEELVKLSGIVEGIKTLAPEPLLLLKQEAELNRRGSIKGEKDIEDVLSILSFCEIDFELYKELVTKYNLDDYPGILRKLIVQEQKRLGNFFMNQGEPKNKKKIWLESLKKVEKAIIKMQRKGKQ